MGSVIMAFNVRSKLEQMARCYERRSTQRLIDEFQDEFFAVKKFARLNGTGTNLVQDDHGNLIGLLGLTGIEQKGGLVTDLHRLLNRYLEVEDDREYANGLWGNFLLFIYIKNTRELKIIKDFAGSIDFCMAKSENGYYLSNSSLALAECLPVSLNEKGIANLATFPSLFADVSLFKEVKRLSPATVYTLKSTGSVECEEYAVLPRHTPDAWVSQKRIASVIERSLQLAECYSDTVGLDLTGGHDTRLILAAALHRQMEFVACVHGEDDGEVRFVRNRIAKPLGFPLHVLRLGRGAIEGFAEKARLCHYLFDGSYCLFDAAMDGCRSLERMKYCDSKINGAGGEFLRDHWYQHLYRVSDERRLEAYLKKRFFGMWCRIGEPGFIPGVFSQEFLDYIHGEYATSVGELIEKHIEESRNTDIGYVYGYLMFMLPRRGWVSEICGSHNRIVVCAAPYHTKQFIERVLPGGIESKRAGHVQLELIRFLSEECSKVPLITGYPCEVKTSRNAWRFWVTDRKKAAQRLVRFLGRRVFRKTLVFDHKYKYKFGMWFDSLYSDGYVRQTFENIDSIVPGVFNGDNVRQLAQEAIAGRLSMAQYRFLGSIATLALTYGIATGNGY